MSNQLPPPAGDSIRVRFAPSPTGDLHVGGVRSALFNWFYARHFGGKFLLRVEDTDRERSTDAAIQVILDGLQWLGLNWDEEVLFQSRRAEEHRDAAVRLLDSGVAYRCFCSPDEMAKAREDARAKGLPYKYDRRCKNLSAADIQRNLDAGVTYAVRLAVPEGDINFHDGVHGDITVAGGELEDFVLLRSDGSPTYMLAVVVDDLFMRVTHIIRGDDHITNTPKQILIYRALGHTPPRFAHIPLILGPDKKKLSKRHGATSITAYRELGFLPDAMVNYLGLLGWSPGDDRDVISREELVKLFDIPGIIPRGAVFDEAKLRWLNGHYISQTDYDAVSGELAKFAAAAVDEGALDHPPDEEQVKTAWEALRSRIHTLPELFTFGGYFFRDPEDYDHKGARKYFSDPNVHERLNLIAEDFAQIPDVSAAACEDALRRRAEAWGVKAGELIHPVRLAVSGTTVGPGLFELLELLGRSAVVRRLRSAAEAIKDGVLTSETHE